MVSLDDDENRPLVTGSEQDDLLTPSGTEPDTARRQRSANDGEHPDAPLDLDVEIDDSSPPTPRFIQDEGSWKRWKWVPYRFRHLSTSIAQWSKGPVNPQPWHIKPFFPMVQEYPLFLVERFIPKFKHRAWLLAAYFSIWFVTFFLIKRRGSMATEIAGWGEPQSIGCGVTFFAAGNYCGIDGSECRPFNGTGFPFRCTANCESRHVLNPRAVGDQEIIYRSFVIGGGQTDGKPTYRGDSFVCASAIHAGIITDTKGGCGVVKLVGRREDYPSAKRHGISSVSFDSHFPVSFNFVEDIDCSAADTRWSLLGLSATFTGVLSIFTNSPALFFFPNFIMMFWTVGMALDPPPYVTLTSLFSRILGKFLPAMFCAWTMYDRMGVRRTLHGLTAQFEKTILWLGACWVGAMNNYTLSFIPIQRLTKHDLDQQPGARAALATIVLLLFTIIVCQAWFFRQEGRMIRYLKLYGLFIGGIFVCLGLPGLNLRIHHYILALLLLPGTSMQTRPCLLYQGLLVGLFINGIARWGFDPLLETPAALQSDAQKGTRLPVIQEPIIHLANNTINASTIAFKWDDPPSPIYDGISILVNDVERFRTYFDGTVDEKKEFIWTRPGDLDLPEYFRFGFMKGSSSGDYSKAGTWTEDGDWRRMKIGPSRVKIRSTGEEERIRR